VLLAAELMTHLLGETRQPFHVSVQQPPQTRVRAGTRTRAIQKAASVCKLMQCFH